MRPANASAIEMFTVITTVTYCKYAACTQCIHKSSFQTHTKWSQHGQVYNLVRRPESGAEVLISAWTSLNFGCLESPSNSNRTDSLVVTNTPAARIRYTEKERGMREGEADGGREDAHLNSKHPVNLSTRGAGVHQDVDIKPTTK